MRGARFYRSGRGTIVDENALLEALYNRFSGYKPSRLKGLIANALSGEIYRIGFLHTWV